MSEAQFGMIFMVPDLIFDEYCGYHIMLEQLGSQGAAIRGIYRCVTNQEFDQDRTQMPWTGYIQ